MVFSSITFLYYFLPVVLVLSLITGRIKGRGGQEARNAVLLAASLFFYFWGEPVYLLLMLAVTAVSYAMGWWIAASREKPYGRLVFALAVAIALAPLLVCKYGTFILTNLAALFGRKTRLKGPALPVGISFYTFQLLSYLIDLFWGRIRLQKRPDRLLLYVSLFPQLIAGPIVRYAQIEKELEERPGGMERFARGMERFAVGLGKKVLIANVAGGFCEIYQASAERNLLFAWMYAVAISLQLYFDFSGYSDMAIGLGTMFGFSFPENFNYPFISRSITEFWRRWHMTLGSWFRDYVYIPLGGSRVGKVRLIGNLFVVWMLTGLWHGAAWNFVLWGLFFGVLLAAEKLLWGLGRKRPPESGAAGPAKGGTKKAAFLGFSSAIGWLYTTVLVLISFIIFHSANLAEVGRNVGALFMGSAAGRESLYYLRSYGVFFAAAIFGATPLPKRLFAGLCRTRVGGRLADLGIPLACAALLVVCTAFLVDESFNPFLYFRF